MSWTRKLFVGGGGGSRNTEITTVWSTSWSTNTSRTTELATGRDTTTLWGGAPQATEWNTNRTTYGTIDQSYSTQWNTSKTTSTTWTVQSNVVVGSDSRNTTTNFTTHWTVDGPLVSVQYTQPESRSTNTLTSTTTAWQAIVGYGNTSRSTNYTQTNFRNSCADVMQTTNWNTPFNTTCTTTSQSVTVTYSEFGCFYYLDANCGQYWYQDSPQYAGQNGCVLMYTNSSGSCEQTDANRSRQCFTGETHCPETQTVINCVTQFRNTNRSTLKEQCNQVVDYYSYVPGSTSWQYPIYANTSRATNTLTSFTTNWNVNTTRLSPTAINTSRGTSRSTNTAWDIYSTTINTYSRNTITNWNPSRVTTTSYEGNYSTNWNTNSTTGGGEGPAESRNTTTSFNTNWTTEYSNNTTVDTDRTTSWLTS